MGHIMQKCWKRVRQVEEYSVMQDVDKERTCPLAVDNLASLTSTWVNSSHLISGALGKSIYALNETSYFILCCQQARGLL